MLAPRPPLVSNGLDPDTRVAAYTETGGVMDKVKVTVNLPRDLVKRAKIAAIERGVDLQDLMAEGLRLALSRKGAAR